MMLLISRSLSWLLSEVTSGPIAMRERKVIGVCEENVQDPQMCSPMVSWFSKVMSLLYLLVVHPAGIPYLSQPLELTICLSQLGEVN